MELRLRMIVDSGSTKTDWLVGCEDGQFVCRCSTQGINPFHQSESDIAGIVEWELMPQLSAELAKAGLDQHQIGSIRFYGAGCRGEAIGQLRNVLTLRFPSASEILVGSDLLAAAFSARGQTPDCMTVGRLYLTCRPWAISSVMRAAVQCSANCL